MLYRIESGLGDAAYESCLSFCETNYPWAQDAEANRACTDDCSARQKDKWTAPVPGSFASQTWVDPAAQTRQPASFAPQSRPSYSLFQLPPLTTAATMYQPAAAMETPLDWKPLLFGGLALVLLLTLMRK